MKPIAIVYPSAKVRMDAEGQRNRMQQLADFGIHCDLIEPTIPSENGYTSGSVLERACLLSYALTQRKYSKLWAARGGYGVTEIIPYLEHMLPPVLPPKTLIGFSDASFLGHYLSTRFPNFSYIHGNHAFDSTLFTGSEIDRSLLFQILKGKTDIPDQTFHSQFSIGFNETSIEGKCIPLNLSLAESAASMDALGFAKGSILFLEDLNEDLFRLLRKFDSLVLSGNLKNISAIVLGNFSDCQDSTGQSTSVETLATLLWQKCKLPIGVYPIFGHAQARLPLVYGSHVTIDTSTILLRYKTKQPTDIKSPFDPLLFSENLNASTNPKIYFCGIGGTGMAAVAGLFQQAGYEISGSDNPIYPPMDKVIQKLGITPFSRFHETNVGNVNPDAIVLANVLSRKNAELKPNVELENLLSLHTPVYSFPSALRKIFLSKSKNILVAGTHGKTTTSSLITHSLNNLGLRPSYMIGGTPKNFESGFALRDPTLFVLEADEYDSAFFDKGPKFLHYEPSVTLINNIEFDHADIYPNIEAIKNEFGLLAQLTKERGGISIANLDDKLVAEVCQQSNGVTIGFGTHESKGTWCVLAHETQIDGTLITLQSPNALRLTFKVQLFGKHNALNIAASFATITALQIIQRQTNPLAPKVTDQDVTDFYNAFTPSDFMQMSKSFEGFLGVSRRFELLGTRDNIAVFNDFAHHPTAVATTIKAFRDYMKASARTGHLHICFDPRNATMRRSVLANELAASFCDADFVYLGRIPHDQRLTSNEAMDGPTLEKLCGSKSRYFNDNVEMTDVMIKEVKQGDTIVFMSSGAFENIPQKFLDRCGQL